MPKSGTKTTLLGYFWQKTRYLGISVQDFLKNYSHVWNHHPPVCLIAKFWEKEMPNFGTKNALFGCFCAWILKNYCDIWNQYLRVCLIAKFCEEKKYLNVAPKMPYHGILDKKCFIWVF